tara:strand:+ start:5081 stop:5872 length:792 start_codon:yes stop_codon:yes gene_type:complete
MERIGFIGGSDAVQIMHGDWQKLWEIKTGRVQPDDLSNNFTVQSGVWNEQFILSWFEKQSQLSIDKQQVLVSKVHNNVPLQGTIDATVRSQASIVEAKETNQFNNFETQLKRYMPQIQFYLGISNYSDCFFANKFGNLRFEYRKISFNQSYFSSLIANVKMFWSHVENNTPPDPNYNVTPDSIDNILVDDMIKRDASKDNHFVSLAHGFLETQDKASKHEEIKKELKSIMLKNEREVYCEQLKLKKDKRGAIRITTNKGENDG